jgi:hypothetical protein
MLSGATVSTLLDVTSAVLLRLMVSEASQASAAPNPCMVWQDFDASRIKTGWDIAEKFRKAANPIESKTVLILLKNNGQKPQECF